MKNLKPLLPQNSTITRVKEHYKDANDVQVTLRIAHMDKNANQSATYGNFKLKLT